MTSTNIYYVYIYSDPDTNVPFYVGYGQKYRKNDHLNYAILHPSTKIKSNKNDHKLNKIRKLIKNNKLPKIDVVKENLTHEEATMLEISLIQKYGRSFYGGCLTNKTDGGDGGYHTKGTVVCVNENNEKKRFDKDDIPIGWKIFSGTKNTKWITDGNVTKRINKEADIPNGFSIKRHLSGYIWIVDRKGNRTRISSATKTPDGYEKEKFIWITDGHTTRRFTTNFSEILPDGWVKTAVKRDKFIWITNGHANSMIKTDDNIPEGFFKGRTI